MWKPVIAPTNGSYFSTNDVAGNGVRYVSLLNGKNREDPDNVIGSSERTQGNANLLSDAGRTLYFTDDRVPKNGGEYGFDISYLASNFNNTTFEFAYLNLHSRFPIFSFIASDEGCTNRANNQAEALAACMGFAPAAPIGQEPLPLDTVKLFRDYPTNIHSFGFSFSTNLGPLAWTGEVVYRPNQPLQVDPLDVGFAALQPTFPANTLSFGAVDVPGERVATPDYIETIYRGNTVAPGQIIRGYERFQTLSYNTSFLLLFGASENPFAADQITTLLEIGAYQILNLPSLDRLQIASPGLEYHHSAGVDGTGTPNAQQQASAPQNRLNGHFQEGGYATSFSYGYRILTQFAYEDLIPNARVAPQLIFFHDVDGRSPLPTGEFFKGRKQATLGLNVVYNDSIAANLRYNWSFGGGVANSFSDRDNVQISLSYDF